jgi:hypothetical protein
MHAGDPLPMVEPLEPGHRCPPIRFTLCWHVTLQADDGRALRYAVRSDSSVGARVIVEQHAGVPGRVTAVAVGPSDPAVTA